MNSTRSITKGKDLNWDDFRYFLALARGHTVSEAGRVLGVKHTTVARRIKSLEDGLATRLFDHLPDGYAMTQAGENLYQHALEMEQRALAVERETLGLDTQLKGELNLTASHDVANRLIVPHLGLFNRAYPEVELNLLSSAGLVDLAARQADIALRLTPRPPEYLIGKKVLPLRHGIYATEGYLKKKRQHEQVILWLNETEKPEWVTDNFKNSKVIIRTSDITTMQGCVENHMGLARMPCYIGDSSKALKRLNVKLKPSDWGLWVLSHVDLRATARVRACREFLIDIIEQQKGLVEGLDSNYIN